MTEKSKEILQILRDEYGIKTAEDLDKAIEKLSLVDLTPFCGNIKKTKSKEKSA